eukprot:scpid47191/ scgid8718/ Mevalonate kinase
MENNLNEEEGELVVSAPGKAILHGEHAVVYGKRAIAASVDLRCYLRLREVAAPTVELNVRDLDIHAKWSLDEVRDLSSVCESDASSRQSEACDARLHDLSSRVGGDDGVKVLAAKTFLFLAGAICFKRSRTTGIDVQVTSSLPFASGLGSSASYSVCLAAAFLLRNGEIKPESLKRGKEGDHHEQLERLGLQSSSKYLATSFSQDDLDLVRRWSFQGERIIHGTPSGIDNAVATFGGALEFCRAPGGDHIRTIESPPILTVLLTNTKVPRSTKVLVAGVRSWLEEMPAVAKPIMDAVDGISEQCCKYWDDLEGADVKEKEVIFSHLGRLVDANQSLLSVMGVSHPAIETVCQISAACGLHSKLTGAGGGGCVITFFTQEDQENGKVADVKTKLESSGFDVYNTVLGGPGVALHQLDDA